MLNYDVSMFVLCSVVELVVVGSMNGSCMWLLLCWLKNGVGSSVRLFGRCIGDLLRISLFVGFMLVYSVEFDGFL